MGELPIMVLMTLLYGGTIQPDTSTNTPGSSWSYHGNSEPNNWHQSYPTCSGKRQSPININTEEVRSVNWLKPFVFYNYPSDSTKQVAATLVNNGHTASLALSSQWFIGGGNLKERYQAAEVHFHWDAMDEGGAEHSVNGYKHAMEIQMIFFATKYGNMTNAIKHHDGLASIAVFADISPEDNPVFEDLIGSLHKVSDNGMTSDLLSFRLTDFLPRDSQAYYHYMGSLTTPPCHESVMWYVMNDRISLSSRQVESFRSLKTGVDGAESNTVERIRDNVRPVQPLFGRTVFSSKRALTVPPINTYTKHIIKKRQVSGSIRQFKLSGSIRSPFRFSGGIKRQVRIAPAVVEERQPLSVGHFFGQKKSVSSMNTQVQPIGNINQKSSHTNHIIDPAAGSGGAPAWKSPPSSAGTASKSNWAWPGTKSSGSWSPAIKEPNVPPPPPTELSKTTTSNFALEFQSANNHLQSVDLTSNVQFGAVQGFSVQPPEVSAIGNSISNSPKIGGAPNDPHMQFAVQPEVLVSKIGTETSPTTMAGTNPTVPVTVPAVDTTLSPITPDPALVKDTRIPTAATLRVERQHMIYPTTTSPINAQQTWPITAAAPTNGIPVKTPQQQAPSWSARQNEPGVPAEPPSQTNPVHQPTFVPPTTAKSPQTTTSAWQPRVSEPAIQEAPQRLWQSGVADLTKQQPNANTRQASQSSWQSGGSQVSGSVQQQTWNAPGARGWQSRFRPPAPALTQKTPAKKEWHPIASNPTTNNQGQAAASNVPRDGKASWRYNQNWQNKAQAQTVSQPQNTANKWEAQARTPAANKVAPQPSPTPSGMPNNSTIEDAVGWFVAQLKSGAFQARHQQLWDLLESAITQYKKDTAKPGMEQKITEQLAKLQKLGGRLRNSVTLAPNPQTYSQHQNGQSSFVSSPESPQAAQHRGSYVQPVQQYPQQARGFQYHEVPPQRSAHRKHDPPRSRYNQEVKSVNSMNKIDRGVNAGSVSLSNLHGKNSPDTITVPQDITVFTPVNGGNPESTPVPNYQTQPSSVNNPQQQHISRNAEFNVAQPNQVQQQQHGFEPNAAQNSPISTTFEQITTMATPTTTIKAIRKKPTFSIGNSNTASSFKISGGGRFSAKSFSAHKSKSSVSFSPKSIKTWSDPAAELKEKLRLQQEQQLIQERKERERLKLEQQRQEQERLLLEEQQRQEDLRLEQERILQEQLRVEQEQKQLLLQQEQEQLRLQQEQQRQNHLRSQTQQQNFQSQQQHHLFNPSHNPFEPNQPFQQTHNQLQQQHPQQQHFNQHELQQQQLQQQQLEQQQLQQQQLEQQQLQQQQLEQQQLEQQQLQQQQLEQQQLQQQQLQQQQFQQQFQQQQQQQPHQFQQQQQPQQQQSHMQQQYQHQQQQHQQQPPQQTEPFQPPQQQPHQPDPFKPQQQQHHQPEPFQPPQQQQHKPEPFQFPPQQQHQQQQFKPSQQQPHQPEPFQPPQQQPFQPPQQQPFQPPQQPHQPEPFQPPQQQPHQPEPFQSQQQQQHQPEPFQPTQQQPHQQHQFQPQQQQTQHQQQQFQPPQQQQPKHQQQQFQPPQQQPQQQQAQQQPQHQFNPMDTFQIQPQQIQSQQNQPQQQPFVDPHAASQGQQFGSRSGVNVPPSASGSVLDQALGVNPSQPKVNYGANANTNSIIPNKGPEVVPIGQPQQQNPWAQSSWVDPIAGGAQSAGSAGGQIPNQQGGNMPNQPQHSPFNPFGAQNPFQPPEAAAVPRQEFMQTPTKVAKAPGFRGRVASTASALQAGHQQMHAHLFERPPPTTMAPLAPVTKAVNFWNQPVVTPQVPTAIATHLTYRPTTYAPPVTKMPSPPSRWAPMMPQSMQPRQPTAPVTTLHRPASSAKPKPKPKARKAKAKRKPKKRYNGFLQLLSGRGPRLTVSG